MIKRYLLAFVALLATSFVLGTLFDAILQPQVAATLAATIPSDSASAERETKTLVVWQNTATLINIAVSFMVAGFILRKRSVVPALVVYCAAAMLALWQSRRLYSATEPSTTYWDILSANPIAWFGGLAAAMIGAYIGKEARRRHEQTTLADA